MKRDAIAAFQRWGLKTLGEVAALPSADLSARLKELEHVVQDLRAETAFLKKATAYFARDQRL